MTSVSKLNQINIGTMPSNSSDVVTGVDATIRDVRVTEKDGNIKLFINLQTKSGVRFADVTTFKGDEEAMASTLKYLSAHTSNLFKQLGEEYDSYTATFKQILEKLKRAQEAKAVFKMSTVASDYKNPSNPEATYVDVLYGDEVRA